MKEEKREIVTVRNLSSGALAGTIIALLFQNHKFINSRKKEWKMT